MRNYDPAIDHPISDSWASHDHVRHHMYNSIYHILKSQVWTQDAYKVLEIGTQQPTSSIMRMLFSLLGNRCKPSIGDYPDLDIQDMRRYAGDDFDVTIADQVLEHVERIWDAADELYRVTKPGGLCIVATPIILHIHPNPLDCWRILPDGYKVLFPAAKWEWLTLDMWGRRDIVEWEMHSPVTRGFTGDWLSVADAYATLPGYDNPASDGLLPVVIWWIGRKK